MRSRLCKNCEPCTAHPDLHGIARMVYWGKVLRPVLPLEYTETQRSFEHEQRVERVLRAGRAE